MIIFDQDLFPKHHQMTITHNEHHTNYESVEKYLERVEHIYISKEDAQECVRRGEIWEIQWYPCNPSGFHCVGSFSLEKCLNIIIQGDWA